MNDDPRVVVPTAVAYVYDDQAVYVAIVPDGPIRVVEGAGAIIWNAIGDGRQISQVVMAVAAIADLTEDEVREDVRSFLGDLRTLGLVRFEPVGDAP